MTRTIEVPYVPFPPVEFYQFHLLMNALILFLVLLAVITRDEFLLVFAGVLLVMYSVYLFTHPIKLITDVNFDANGNVVYTYEDIPAPFDVVIPLLYLSLGLYLGTVGATKRGG